MKDIRQRSKEPVYIAIDLKSFYASVECVARGLDPLTANLVVADSSRTEKTICLAVSPNLKTYGIPGRARVFEVEQRLKEVKRCTGESVQYIMAKPRMARYIEVSSKIYEVYLKYLSPEDIHVYSIDECFMDVTDYLDLYDLSARELATRMVQDVLEQTGITATVGIGTNLYLCKIAMDIVAKHEKGDENGVRIAELNPLTYRKTLWNHKPITDFWRVGRGIAERLESRNLFTMGDIAKISIENEDLLYKMLGIDAELLIDHAWGVEPCQMRDIKAYKASTHSISSGQVLKNPYNVEMARIVVQEMTDQLVLELVEKDMMTDSLTLHVGYDRCCADEKKYQGMITKDHYGRSVPKPAHGTAAIGVATNSTKKIVGAVMSLYDNIVLSNLMIRRINISANNLIKGGYEQLDLFSNVEAREKERKMQDTMLLLKKKFGKNAILKGINLEKGATTIERNQQIGGHKA